MSYDFGFKTAEELAFTTNREKFLYVLNNNFPLQKMQKFIIGFAAFISMIRYNDPEFIRSRLEEYLLQLVIKKVKIYGTSVFPDYSYTIHVLNTHRAANNGIVSKNVVNILLNTYKMYKSTSFRFKRSRSLRKYSR